jgi:hypothetical protein
MDASDVMAILVFKSSNSLSFSPDCSGNPFFNCLGFKPKAIEKRLQRKAGKWIAKMPKRFASNKKAKLHYF